MYKTRIDRKNFMIKNYKAWKKSRLTLVVIILAVMFSLTVSGDNTERLVYRAASPYSKILVKDRGNIRSLYFVRKDGTLATETSIDKRKPWRLILSYSRFMFVHLLFSDNPRQGLLIGLGGGGMVHFLNYHYPRFRLDLVEIDPVVARIAKQYFLIKENAGNRVYAEDGFRFIARVRKTYDVIYTDAFIKNIQATDSTGVPLNLKTRNYYKNLKKKIRYGGTAVFDLHNSNHLKEDIRFINSFFPNVYVFKVPNRGNVVVAASTLKRRFTRGELLNRAHVLDRKIKKGFSFTDILKAMSRDF
jgi:spermidine synthase